MDILLCEFRQESNSFNPVYSTLDFWRKSGIYIGKDIEENLAKKPCAVAGLIKGAEDTDPNVKITYGICMSCQSGGPAKQEVMEYFLKELSFFMDKKEYDGILISFHGALQTTEFQDAEGEVIKRIRNQVGEKVIIGVSTDLHAFLSDDILANADIICGYHTYPHTDFFETGYRTGKLTVEKIKKIINPVIAKADVPMIVSAASYSTMEGAFKKLMDYAKTYVTNEEIYDFTIYQMQPWLDIYPASSSVVVIANNKAKAEAISIELANKLLEFRKEFTSQLFTIDEVIDFAEREDIEKPVLLIDSADSCNAGATGDSMAVAERIIARSSIIKAAVVVNDAVAVERAFELGIGNTGHFKIGGTKDNSSVSVEIEGYVKSLHDGVFYLEGPASKGMKVDIGNAAVIVWKNLHILVCEWMAGNGDLQLFRAFGIEPTLFDLLGIKACTSFRAGYTKITSSIYETDTPGAATTAIERLQYRNIPKSFYPWSSLDNFKVRSAKFGR